MARKSSFWRGSSLTAALIQTLINKISPRLACRWTDYHSWDGAPVNDTCRFCGLKI